MANIGPGTSIKKKKFSQVKNPDDKFYMVQDAVRTFKRLSETKREIKAIKADKELMAEVRVALKQEIADTKTALKT